VLHAVARGHIIKAFFWVAESYNNGILLLIYKGWSLMKIKRYFTTKGHRVITIGPDETVKAALQKLVDNNIGALPVCDATGQLVGIISERDILKECLNQNESIDVTKIKEVMSTQVAVATPDDDLNYATSVMKQKNVRHLPVVVNSKIDGMISMRDIVNSRLQDVEAEIRYEGLLHHRSRRPLI
jgi:CBS domain-containing protein